MDSFNLKSICQNLYDIIQTIGADSNNPINKKWYYILK